MDQICMSSSKWDGYLLTQRYVNESGKLYLEYALMSCANLGPVFSIRCSYIWGNKFYADPSSEEIVWGHSTLKMLTQLLRYNLLGRHAFTWNITGWMYTQKHTHFFCVELFLFIGVSLFKVQCLCRLRCSLSISFILTSAI